MAQSTFTIDPDEIKTEDLHMFDNIDGELNLNTTDSKNSKMSEMSNTDVKNEVWSNTTQMEKSIGGLNCNLSNGNIDIKLENNSSTTQIYEVDITDENYNLNFNKLTSKTLMPPVEKKNEPNAASEISWNSKLGISNVNKNSDYELIIRISGDSDTDEVESDSSGDDDTADDKLPLQRDESLLEESTGSVLGNESINNSSNEASQDELTKKSNPTKSNKNTNTLLKFLVPLPPIVHKESPVINKENNDSSRMVPIRILQLLINSCLNCAKEFTCTSGAHLKKCKLCGKRVKFHCFMCDKLFNERSGVYSHVVQSHRFSIVLFNEQIHSFIKRFCSKCKYLFDSDHTSCSKCNSALAFSCALCKERCETRSEINMHVARSHSEHFVTSPKITDQNPKNSGKRQSIVDKSVTTETPTKSNKLSDPKQNVTNRRKSTTAVDATSSSKRKNSTEALPNNEDASTQSKQQVTRSRRSSKNSKKSSEANNINEIISTTDGFSAKTSDSVSKISDKQSVQVQMSNNAKSDVASPSEAKKLNLPDRRKSTSAKISGDKSSSTSETFVISDSTAANPAGPSKRAASKRRSSAVAKEENVKRKGHNVEIPLESSSISTNNSSVNQQISKKRRNSRISSDNDLPSSENNITFADVHAAPRKDEPKQQIIDKRRNSHTKSKSTEASSHSESTPISADTISDLPATKQPVAQGRRPSLKSTVDTSEITSVEITDTPQISGVSKQQVAKRRKSVNSNSSETNSLNDISIDKSTIKDEICVGASVDLHCTFCHRMFENQKSCQNHERYCGKGLNLSCDLCSFATKYAWNLKKHKLTVHGTPMNSETIEDENVDFGVLYTADSTCADILNKMEVHCPNCKADANMKPTDSICRRCRSKLLLTCVKCCKVFGDFLSIFNHLYKECSSKQYHCIQCIFSTSSFDIVQAHVHNVHRNKADTTFEKFTDTLDNFIENKESVEMPFVFSAEPKAPVISDDFRMKLRAGFKTREQNRVKPKDKVTAEAALENESKMQKCPRCNKKVAPLMKHLVQCKLRCPFCAYTSKSRHVLRKHLLTCHKSKSSTNKFRELLGDGRILKRRAEIDELMQCYCKTCDELQESVPYEIKCATCQTNLEYRCTKCQAKFSQRDQLRKHVSTHTKKLNSELTCSACFKGFAFAENLRMHQKVCTHSSPEE